MEIDSDPVQDTKMEIDSKEEPIEQTGRGLSIVRLADTFDRHELIVYSNIRELTVRNLDPQDAVDVFQYIITTKSAQMEKLDLGRDGPCNLSRLVPMPKFQGQFKRLQYLDLSGVVDLSGHGLSELVDIIWNFWNLTLILMCTHITRFKDLRQTSANILNVSYNYLDSRDVRDIIRFLDSPQLVSLDISHNYFRDEDIRELINGVSERGEPLSLQVNDQHIHYIKPETLLAVEMLANKKPPEQALEDVKAKEERDQKQHEYISYRRVGFDYLFKANPNWRLIGGIEVDVGSAFEYLPKFKQLHTLILVISRMKETELHKLMPITKIEGLTKLRLGEHQDEPMSFPKKFLRALSKMPNLQYLELPMYFHSAIELLRSESIQTLHLFNPFDVAQDRIDKLFSAFMQNTSLEQLLVIGAEDEINETLEEVYNHFSRLGIYRDMLPHAKIMIEHLKENKEKRLQMQKIMPILMGAQLGARNLNQIINFLPTIYNFTGDIPIEQKEARALEQLIDPRKTVNPEQTLTRTKRKLVELERRPLPLMFDTSKPPPTKPFEEEPVISSERPNPDEITLGEEAQMQE